MSAMSSGLPDPTRPNAPLNFARSKACPRCHSDVIVWLAQMRRIDQERDWYRCKKCGEEFAIDRTPAAVAVVTPSE
jgi:DNA-directed RNA polymerase subunit M/transcription elongation factor TFIIS